jgi:hypothetical protein
MMVLCRVRRDVRAGGRPVRSGAERKNSWTIAEQAGDLFPDGMQHRWSTGSAAQ